MFVRSERARRGVRLAPKSVLLIHPRASIPPFPGDRVRAPFHSLQVVRDPARCLRTGASAVPPPRADASRYLFYAREAWNRC